MDWSILKNPSVWSVFIAALALILSQLPPLRQLMKGIKLKIIVPEQFLLYHFLGNIQINLVVDIHNIGGRSVSISKLDCMLTDNQGHKWSLPARTYYSRQPPSQPGATWQEFLLGSIPLKPGENWNETVRCFRLWTEAEEEEANNLISQIKKDISSKFPSPTLVEADQKLIEVAVSFFKKNFDLRKGNYQLFIAALSEETSVLAVRGFDITLFESHIRTLEAHTEQYKYGFGIYIPLTDPTQNVWIRLRQISDNEQVLKIYEKLRSK